MVIVLGIAGSGKSTQCEKLIGTGRFQWLSIGQMLREAIQDPELKKIIASGDMLDDDLVIPMVEAELKKRGDDPELLLDGFPRTIDQSDWLLRLHGLKNINISTVIHLKVSEEVALNRLLKRGRTDDHETAIAERFNEYHENAMVILGHLMNSQVRVVEVSGEDTSEMVFENLVKALNLK